MTNTCAACGHLDTDHDMENEYGEAVVCHCSCPDFVRREDDSEGDEAAAGGWGGQHDDPSEHDR